MRRFTFSLILIFLFLGIFSNKLPIVSKNAEFIATDGYITIFWVEDKIVEVASACPVSEDTFKLYHIWGMRYWSTSEDAAIREGQSILLFYSFVFLLLFATIIKNGWYRSEMHRHDVGDDFTDVLPVEDSVG